MPLLADETLDVVLLDIRLGSARGLHLLSPEHQTSKPAIVVLTAYDYPKYAEAALRMGAVGYVLKSSPFNELLTAIRKAAAGEFVFGVRPSAHVRPTPRESAIVSLVVDGRSNDEIGGHLDFVERASDSRLRSQAGTSSHPSRRARLRRSKRWRRCVSTVRALMPRCELGPRSDR